MNEKNLLRSNKLFFISLGVDTAVTALVAISAFWTLGTLRDIQAGTLEVSDSLLSTLEFWENFSKLTIVTTFGVGFGLVKWLNACYRHARNDIGATGFLHEGWTTTAWIIPVYNLFKPYKIINEIYRAGSPDYETPEGWKKEAGSGLLLTWWIVWSITHFIMGALGREMLKRSFRDDLTFDQVIGIYHTQAAACMVSLAIVLLWFMVANHLTRRLLNRTALETSLSASTASPTDAEPVRTAPASSMPSSTALDPYTPASMSESVSAMPVATAKVQTAESAASAAQNNDEAIYAEIARELDTGNTDRGLWTKLFAECDGDENRTRVAYIRQRAARLKSAETAPLAAGD